MGILDSEKIFGEIRETHDRLSALGITRERYETYSHAIGTFGKTEGEAFAEAVAGLDLTEEERAFVREALANGAPDPPDYA